MTRITLSEFKKAARDRSLRRLPTGTGSSFPTPMPIAASAVRQLHRAGAPSANAQLDAAFNRSTHWGASGPAHARGWATSIRSSFQTYVTLASADARPALAAPVSADVQIGTNTVGVSLDVVLLDPAGYVGRYLLWDKGELTQDNAELLAAPLVQMLQQELGEDRVAGIEIWHLRTGTQSYVDAPTALGRLHEVGSIIDNYLS